MVTLGTFRYLFFFIKIPKRYNLEEQSKESGRLFEMPCQSVPTSGPLFLRLRVSQQMPIFSTKYIDVSFSPSYFVKKSLNTKSIFKITERSLWTTWQIRSGSPVDKYHRLA